MNQNKTQPNRASVQAFVSSIEDDGRREDARLLIGLLSRVTGEEPRMWGDQMIGFGSYHYRYDSGREGDWLATGFAPRKRETVIYLMADAPDRDQLLANLGKHRTGKSCLYVRRLSDIDLKVLEKLVRGSLLALRERYPQMPGRAAEKGKAASE